MLPYRLLLTVPAALMAISIHEFAHGAAADYLGDPTPRLSGRLTLNPLAHLDPIGALMLVFFRFGWAKPVMINPRYFRDSRRGMMYVALAGPLANITLAYFFALIGGLIARPLQPMAARLLINFFEINIALNLWLAAFNLIPVPPLDGSKILMGLLPGRQAYALGQLEAYGPLLLVFLIMSGLARQLLLPIVRALTWGMRFL
ncbi:MAG: site-2 protease family protein [Limnochordia bacterium]|jgi:Zn-dependent protease|nr:site-2 protease family protein [Bacillota bacterium]